MASTEAAPAANAVSSAAARVRARYAPEAKLLQFPVQPKAEPKAETDAAKESAPSEPAWRELARAKVREHQQRRQGVTDGPTPPATPEDPTAQLIVESALKRIRRTQAPPTVRPWPRSPRNSGGQAVARALEYDEEPVAETAPLAPEVCEPAPALRAAATAAQPLAQTPRQPTPESLRARLAAIAPAATVAAAAPTPVSAATSITTRPDAETTVTPALAAPALIAPALIALEQPAETHANAGKKSNVWIGKPAPIWLRALAGAVDLEAAALAYLPFFGAYTSLDGPPEWGDLYLMASILAVVVYLYQLITYSFNGRTFGMALCGLRCVDLTDASTPITFKRRLWQSLGGAIGLLCPPFNYVVTRVTEYQRGLADALGQTITLRRSGD